jgi:hypothetical protein
MVSETYWHWLISDIAFLAILLEENAPIIVLLGTGLVVHDHTTAPISESQGDIIIRGKRGGSEGDD